MRRVHEKKAESKTNAWYDALWPHTRRKLNGAGNRGWPDQLYMIPGGRPLMIEFKAEGEEPRKLQAHIHERLRENGYEIEVHTKAEEAIASIRKRVEAARGKSKAAGRAAERSDAKKISGEERTFESAVKSAKNKTIFKGVTYTDEVGKQRTINITTTVVAGAVPIGRGAVPSGKRGRWFVP